MPVPDPWRDMLPYRAEPDQVEHQAQPVRRLEAGQAVIQPPDRRVATMPPKRFLPHPFGGLDGHNTPAPDGEPGGITPGACAHVQHQPRSFGNQVEHGRMRILKERRSYRATNSSASRS
jgi:hypothetical protein